MKSESGDLEFIIILQLQSFLWKVKHDLSHATVNFVVHC